MRRVRQGHLVGGGEIGDGALLLLDVQQGRLLPPRQRSAVRALILAARVALAGVPHVRLHPPAVGGAARPRPAGATHHSALHDQPAIREQLQTHLAEAHFMGKPAVSLQEAGSQRFMAYSDGVQDVEYNAVPSLSMKEGRAAQTRSKLGASGDQGQQAHQSQRAVSGNGASLQQSGQTVPGAHQWTLSRAG